jgi:hypothetical protein
MCARPCCGVYEPPPLTKRFGFLNQKDPEEVRREAEKEAAFEAEMAPSRQLHIEEHLAKDALAVAELIEGLGKRKPKRKKAPPKQCDHGRRKGVCKDCDTGYCQHGRRKGVCKDCGTGYCTHGRVKSRCKDCGTGYCTHGRRKSRCKDCGTGHCQHGRQKHKCKVCRSKATGNRQQATGNGQ